MKENVTISTDDGVVRIDKFLAERYPEYSRAAIAKLFKLNLIKRKGISLRPGEKVRPGAEIEYDLGPLQAVPEVIQLPVIFEDDNVIVVDKPAGIISHARGRFWQEASVASFIRDKISGMDGERGGIVHRLDRATSGVMICAKNVDSLKFMQKQFHDRKVTKKYTAVIKGAPKHDEAIIEAGIMRNLKDPKRFMINPDGKQSTTHYKVKESANGYSMLELTPKTGRTHQLRLHLLHINHPIVGDALYDGEKADRLMLHAHSLEIMLPGGKIQKFTSAVPPELKGLLNATK